MFLTQNRINRLSLFFSVVIVLSSCSYSDELDFFVFDPSQDYPEFPLSLSDVAEISYIKLGGEEDGVFIPTLKSSGIFVDSLHDRIFASHFNIGVLEFDIHGMFLRRIGRLGRGPGEYMNVYFYVQPEEERVGVYDPVKEKFLIYTYDGTFLEDEGISASLFPGFLTFLLQDGYLIDYNPSSVIYYERDGRTIVMSERTLSLFPLDGMRDKVIEDIHYEKPRVLPLDWGEDYYKLMMPGHLIPSRSGIILSTYRSDTTYVIGNDFNRRPFLVNKRHNGVQEGCLYPSGETNDYLFLCYQNNLLEGQNRLYFFAIDKKSGQAYKVTEDVSSPLPGPLQGRIQPDDDGLTKNPEYRFFEFSPQELKENCYDYLPPDLKALVDQCDENSNPILMLIKFKDVTHN